MILSLAGQLYLENKSLCGTSTNNLSPLKIFTLIGYSSTQELLTLAPGIACFTNLVAASLS